MTNLDEQAAGSAARLHGDRMALVVPRLLAASAARSSGGAGSGQGWQILAGVIPASYRHHTGIILDEEAVEQEALWRAAFVVGTNLLDVVALPDEVVIALYRAQTVADQVRKPTARPTMRWLFQCLI